MTRTTREFTEPVVGTRQVGGALRNADDGQGWFVIDNGTHYHVGLGTPYVDGQKLVIPLSPPAPYTGFGAVTPDESLVKLGVSCGVSASKDELRVEFCGPSGQIGPNNPLIKGESKNIWVSWNQPVVAGSPEWLEESLA
jgi:hypothetical protein